MYYIWRGFQGMIVGVFLEVIVFNAGVVFEWLNVSSVSGFQLGFSCSRVIAVIIVSVVGSFLFRIQRMPDYHLEGRIEESTVPLKNHNEA